MKTISRFAILAALTMLLLGCVANEFKTVTPAANGLSIRGAKVFAYSFLDLRDAELGPSMLNEIDKQLGQALAGAGVAMKTLRFKDSEVGRNFSTVSGGMSVPVRQTIDSNAKEEQAYDTQYRLVIFPSKITLSGAWKFYDIRWDLVEVKTGKLVWASTSQGKHLTMWKNDEDPDSRAKVIVDGAIAEMKHSGLI